MDDGRNENGIFNELAQPAKAKRAEKTMEALASPPPPPAQA